MAALTADTSPLRHMGVCPSPSPLRPACDSDSGSSGFPSPASAESLSLDGLSAASSPEACADGDLPRMALSGKFSLHADLEQPKSLCSDLVLLGLRPGSLPREGSSFLGVEAQAPGARGSADSSEEPETPAQSFELWAKDGEATQPPRALERSYGFRRAAEPSPGAASKDELRGLGSAAAPEQQALARRPNAGALTSLVTPRPSGPPGAKFSASGTGAPSLRQTQSEARDVRCAGAGWPGVKDGRGIFERGARGTAGCCRPGEAQGSSSSETCQAHATASEASASGRGQGSGCSTSSATGSSKSTWSLLPSFSDRKCTWEAHWGFTCSCFTGERRPQEASVGDLRAHMSTPPSSRSDLAPQDQAPMALPGWPSKEELKMALHLLDCNEDGKLWEEDLDMMVELAFGVRVQDAPASWHDLKQALMSVDGLVSLRPLQTAVEIGLVHAEVQKMQLLQKSEKQSVLPWWPFVSFSNYLESFNKLDRDRNGVICFRDLQMAARILVGKELSHSQCKDFIKRVDANNNGVVDLNEFRSLMLLLMVEFVEFQALMHIFTANLSSLSSLAKLMFLDVTELEVLLRTVTADMVEYALVTCAASQNMLLQSD